MAGIGIVFGGSLGMVSGLIGWIFGGMTAWQALGLYFMTGLMVCALFLVIAAMRLTARKMPRTKAQPAINYTMGSKAS